MDGTDILAQLGLTDREVEVYLALIKHTSLSASEIAKHTTVSRTHVYEATRGLAELGLITTVHDGRSQSFRAEPLDKLKDLANSIVEDVDTLVEDLASLEAPEPETIIKAYHGKAGIKAVYADTIAKPNSEILVMNVRPGTKENTWDDEYIRHHRLRKKQRKIKSRYITAEPFTVADPTGESRYHPGLEESWTMTIIYQDKVALVFWVTDPKGRMHIDQCSAVIIKSKDNQKLYKKHFEEIWKRSKKCK